MNSEFLNFLIENGFREMGQFDDGTIQLEFRNLALSLPPPLTPTTYSEAEIRNIISTLICNE